MKEQLLSGESKDGSGAERHKAFFDGKFSEIAGNGLMGMGTVFALAGIYEFATGHKVGDLVATYADQLPHIASWMIDHLDHMSVILKAGGGASMITTGGFLTQKKEDSSEDAE